MFNCNFVAKKLEQNNTKTKPTGKVKVSKNKQNEKK